MSELFISVDVETSGPSPDTYSLLSIGAVLVEHADEIFYIELKPDREGFETEALQVCGLSLERLTSEGVDAGQAMARFAEWVTRALNGQRPVFVAYNAPFDWMFVSTYFHRYVGANPFGHSALDMKALYLGLTGASIGAADALFCSLADGYLDSATLATLEPTLQAIRWPDADTTSRDATQGALAQALGVQALAPLAPPLLQHLPALYRHFSGCDIDAILQSLADERDLAHQDWAQATLQTLRRRSPLMLAVTQRQLLAGRRLDLADCFRLELTLGHHAFEAGDFIEGVRALIIDKDNAPRWKYPDHAAVPAAVLERFFTAPWPPAAHPLAELGGA